MASMPSVPLMSARPSFAISVTGSMAAARMATAAGRGSSSFGVSSSPSPMRARAQWASGARSPLAPTEPCSGTSGVRPAFSRARIVSASSGRAPERPMARVRARRSIIARTVSVSIAGPIPAAWERISARWRSSRRSGAMRTEASEPKPVETP